MQGLFFFFQAEDGIRDYKVTGVQTCALPIFALSLFLLIGSGLFVRSLQNLKNIDAGFDRENLTQFVIDYGKDYKVAQRLNLYKQVLSRLEALPGTRSATLSNFSLLSGNRIYNKVVVPGYTPQTEDDAVCNM